ncbi:TPA: glycosyltransferase [Legionella pneumophila subsp. pneumophila]|uniref:Glycosyltransferase family 4 protein n=2 Tax=Legionella pneumophila TaxID=446 RepID=A0A3A6ULP6_LEGPN|nr:glycosyltransferase family 4 protein [Legionella pneumophila]RJY25157.1 glycosyltransferase family 4 protein [Legionella pneumophila subsp. pneumophila]PYB48546.1 glycosyltransferase family 4 protein [Legionella pneumophila]PYB66566.1 glycosyltransferase family 4 protein [Legionella pneumophila]RJY27513.1 glycosyltransferase family 4 protein [Legionella pneumophila subsp. pneumophila]
MLSKICMKILTVLDSYPPDLNGGAYFTHRLAKFLQAKGHEVLVICPSRSLKQGYTSYEGVNLYGVRSWPALGYKNFRVCWPFFIKKGILKAITDFNPDVVHLQGKFFLGGICYRACRKKDIPLIATNHFMPENFFHYTHLPRYFEKWFHRTTWNIVIDMLNHVKIVTTPTHTAANLLKEVHVQKEIHVVSCGVDLQKFQPKQNANLIRQRYKIPDKPILLYAGRLDKEKNLSIAIKAFYKTRQSIDAHFVLTGCGAELQRLKKLVQTLNLTEHVTFTGYLSDAEYPLVYSLANCFVNPGTAELQSIVALEAIASGLPLIAAKAMALPELVKEGVNGYLFDPNDVETLSCYMVKILSDRTLSEQMGRESRKLSQEHDIKRTIEQYETLYQSMVSL